jgi:hypothetical protein
VWRVLGFKWNITSEVHEGVVHIPKGSNELVVFDNFNGLSFQVVVILGGFIDDLFHYILSYV